MEEPPYFPTATTGTRQDTRTSPRTFHFFVVFFPEMSSADMVASFSAPNFSMYLATAGKGARRECEGRLSMHLATGHGATRTVRLLSHRRLDPRLERGHHFLRVRGR